MRSVHTGRTFNSGTNGILNRAYGMSMSNSKSNGSSSTTTRACTRPK
jgi:hypothetical protein